MAERKDAYHACKSLKALGAEAEETVLKLVKHAKPDVRRDACDILKLIATRKSVPALEKAASDSDALTARYAKEALKTAQGEK